LSIDFQTKEVQFPCVSIIGFTGKDIPYSVFKEGFDRTVSRGPDETKVIDAGAGLMGFHRLAIMGLNEEGMQPFSLDGDKLVCNGEIYGFRPIREQLSTKYTFKGESDCEVLLPMYREHGLDMFKMLDAEFALIIYDGEKDSFIAARDPIGIRPLFYGSSKQGSMLFASEAKNLVGLTEEIKPFPPGHYYAGGEFVCYRDPAKVEKVCYDSIETVCANIHDKLVAGIVKDLIPTRPWVFCSAAG
jgi:asparagine synthase (glutamine-hydrolysing)